VVRLMRVMRLKAASYMLFSTVGDYKGSILDIPKSRPEQLRWEVSEIHKVFRNFVC